MISIFRQDGKVGFCGWGQLNNSLRLLAKAIVTVVGETSSWDADQ